MCLAVPLKLTAIAEDRRTGTAELAGGGAIEIGLDVVPDAGVGDYVLVHAGMAIEVLADDDAAEILDAIAEYVVTNDRIAPDRPS